MQLVTLRTFDTAIAAHILKNTLEGEGIVCHIFDENIMTLNPLMNVAVGGIRLQVNIEDLEKAKVIVAEIDGKPLTDEQDETIQCPNCESTELYIDFNSMKDPKGFLSMITSFILFTYPVYSKSVYKCKKCDTEFDKK
ncbi:MAG: DUF2007 domain-containing protein [Crocinitomicaceae bacterium]|nr:DUF2007 domain-containing protein [Crocinitomicaceae bacterium]